MSSSPLQLKSFFSRAFAKLFANDTFRQKAIFHLKQYYYPELEFRIVLGQGFNCPIYNRSALYSFSEIFIEGEYQKALSMIALPTRWLDLGCHYGFFSLYLALLRKRSGLVEPLRALLVDADSRVKEGVSVLLQLNQLADQANFLHGAISVGTGMISFEESDTMSSALTTVNENKTVAARKDEVIKSGIVEAHEVPIIDQDTIMAKLAPPYDLVKIDVEGGEYDFLVAYDRILDATQNLIIEWHSWHRGGGSAQQIVQMLESRGFELLSTVQEEKVCSQVDPTMTVGVYLFGKV